MDARFLGISYVVWGAICLGMAAVFVFLWPSVKAARELSTVRYLLLRWGHAAVWGLLAFAAFLRALAGPAGANVAQVAALAALVLYFTFLGALLRN